MMAQFLMALILVPILGFIGCLLVPKRRERAIFSVAISAISLELVLFAVLGWQWLSTGAHPIETCFGDLFATGHYAFSFELYLDRLSAVFFGMTTLMTTLIFIFSRYYLHREPGFKRFYCTVITFFLGLSLILLAGNFEVLLVGWELIGISSVLLIAFYRDRVLPAKNALKVFSVYRIADAFLLAAIWYAHQIFEGSVRFSELSSVVAEHGYQLTIFGFLILGAALIKSAQFPFSYWLPRAMEGPTTSSAIFYGALSVHMGLFLLLRTYPIWQGTIWLHISIACIGLITALVASSIARTQSTIKTHIAYASITQIGIMFIEVAAGLWWLALIHFVSNAALRTYQLLISPSVVGYLLHDQFFHFVPPPQTIKNTLLGKLRASLYVLGIKEWNMNAAMSHFVWRQLKLVGREFAVLDKYLTQAIMAIAGVACVMIVSTTTLSEGATLAAAIASIIVSLMLYIRAFTTKGVAKMCWNLIFLGHLFDALFLALVSGKKWQYAAVYGAGMIVAFILGHICLRRLELKDEPTTLQRYHGLVYAHKPLGYVFLVACLLFVAFPISPSFFAQDIMLNSIPVDHAYLLVLFCISYLLAGISVLRVYVKTFFGPHEAGYHEIAYESS